MIEDRNVDVQADRSIASWHGRLARWNKTRRPRGRDGRIVQPVLGLDELLRRRLFQPIDLRSVYFSSTCGFKQIQTL